MLMVCNHPLVQRQSMIFVMDNVSFHKTEIVRDVLRGQIIEHQIKTLPTYSPHLNPIEYCFHMWKDEILHRYNQITTDTPLMQQIDECREVVTDLFVARTLDHVYQYYLLCIEGKPLEDFVPLPKREERRRLEREAEERAQKQREEKEEKEREEKYD
jgi:hypothetical protein